MVDGWQGMTILQHVNKNWDVGTTMIVIKPGWWERGKDNQLFLCPVQFDRNYPLVLTLFSLYGWSSTTWYLVAAKLPPSSYCVISLFAIIFHPLSCNLLYKPMRINHWAQINGNIMKLVPFNVHDKCHYLKSQAVMTEKLPRRWRARWAGGRIFIINFVLWWHLVVIIPTNLLFFICTNWRVDPPYQEGGPEFLDEPVQARHLSSLNPATKCCLFLQLFYIHWLYRNKQMVRR